MSKIYNSILFSKTGSQIPVFTSGKTVESRYNPEHDADRLLSSIDLEKNFFIVIGLGSGIFINKLLLKNESAFVLVIENSEEDINFLKQLESVSSLLNNQRCRICSINEIKKTIPELYIAAFYGDLEIIEQRAWVLENQSQIETIKKEIQAGLSIVAADYSVQSHFGKIWQSNIKNNIEFASKNNLYSKSEISNNKKAIIIAAGPTLDQKIEYLKRVKESSFIIATDTAFSTLLANSIKVDAVISIDGQAVSQTHFIHNESFSNILFIFDLTANSNAVKHVTKKGGKIFFCRNEHPLSSLANEYAKFKVLNLYTGSGTVTIAAIDFAIKAGFKDIEVLAADFSYKNYKPYAKGTYLDSNFSREAFHLNSLENNFCKLMFRSELNKISKDTYTSKILNNYKDSFETYLTTLGLDFYKEEEIYKIKNTRKAEINNLESGNFNFQALFDFIKSNITFGKKSIFELSKSELSLLPAVAFFRRKNNEKNEKFTEFLKLAYYSLVGYNI
ncbi:MAG: DUF115 domain-containing protein [Treponema sp.]|nr:DUF115 domain-containing protein [Treponema sp.]